MQLSKDCDEAMSPAHVLACGDDDNQKVTTPLALPIYSLAVASSSNTQCSLTRKFASEHKTMATPFATR